MAKHLEPSDEAIAEARLRGGQSPGPRAEAVGVDLPSRRITLTMSGGLDLVFDAGVVVELAEMPAEALQALRLSPSGSTLSQDALDVDIAVDGLVLHLLGASGWKEAIRSKLAQEAARITSSARAAAARANGKKGGRPRHSELPLVAPPLPRAANQG